MTLNQLRILHQTKYIWKKLLYITGTIAQVVQLLPYILLIRAIQLYMNLRAIRTRMNLDLLIVK